MNSLQQQFGVNSLQELENKDWSHYFKKQHISGTERSEEEINNGIQRAYELIHGSIKEVSTVKQEHKDRLATKRAEQKAKLKSERMFRVKLSGLERKPNFQNTIAPPETFSLPEFKDQGPLPSPWEKEKIVNPDKLYEKKKWVPVDGRYELFESTLKPSPWSLKHTKLNKS